MLKKVNIGREEGGGLAISGRPSQCGLWKSEEGI